MTKKLKLSRETLRKIDAAQAATGSQQYMHCQGGADTYFDESCQTCETCGREKTCYDCQATDNDCGEENETGCTNCFGC
jgi:hypothetical protein